MNNNQRKLNTNSLSQPTNPIHKSTCSETTIIITILIQSKQTLKLINFIYANCRETLLRYYY